jgi:hypothetical protein
MSRNDIEFDGEATRTKTYGTGTEVRESKALDNEKPAYRLEAEFAQRRDSDV